VRCIVWQAQQELHEDDALLSIGDGVGDEIKAATDLMSGIRGIMKEQRR